MKKVRCKDLVKNPEVNEDLLMSFSVTQVISFKKPPFKYIQGSEMVFKTSHDFQDVI